MAGFQIKKLAQLAKEAWLIFGIVLVFFFLAEISLSLFFYVKDFFINGEPKLQDSRTQFTDYRQTSWIDGYFKEFHESFRSHWEPYVYWRRDEYRGKYININPDGIRLSKSSIYYNDKDHPKLKIFVFGGSTIWGTGARDSYTIPSLIVQELDRRGINSEVTNFGESGYVSTQEIILLLLQLQKGNIPDIILFFDGANDTFSAYQNQVPGVPQNEFNRSKEFNLISEERFKDLRNIFFEHSLSSLSIIRLAKSLSKKVGIAIDIKKEKSDSNKHNGIGLAKQVINLYLANIEIVNVLAKTYRFKYFFYWQPTIFQKANLNDYERSEYNKRQYLEFFFKKTLNALSKKVKEGFFVKYNFRDLSLVFLSEKYPIFIDWCHLSERGNAIIAQEMIKDILPLAQSRLKNITKKAN
jgi:hypothetical protein